MNRTRTWLPALGLLCVLSSSAVAQEGWDQEDAYIPRPELEDDYFATPDFSTYGSGPRPPEGLYFNYDYLRMVVSPADTAFIGQPQPDALDTGEFKTQFQNGSRIEFGTRNGNQGWLFSGLTIYANQKFDANDVDIDIGAPITGFDLDTKVENNTRIYGCEVMRTWRKEPRSRPYAPIFEVMWGLRYLYVKDRFNVDITNDIVVIDPMDPMDADDDVVVASSPKAFLNSQTENNLFGPQIGYRLSKQNGPWVFANEARLFTAFNFQSARQKFGTDNFVFGAITFPDSGLDATYVRQTSHATEFAPMAEIRFDIAYQLTRRCRARFGYTGMWISELARASTMVNYSGNGTNVVPVGIAVNANAQDMWTQGFHLGFEVNH